MVSYEKVIHNVQRSEPSAIGIRFPANSQLVTCRDLNHQHSSLRAFGLLALNPPISHNMETSEPGQPAQDPITTPVPSTEPTSAPEPQKQTDQQKPSSNDEADEDSDFDELDGAILPLTLSPHHPY